MSWESYSPDFENAYQRRFKSHVSSERIFNEWVKEYDRWINTSRILKREPLINPTLRQVKALAYEAKEAGLNNISREERVRDDRTAKGYRNVFRNVNTYTDDSGKKHYGGRFAKNPYKEYGGDTKSGDMEL